MYYSTADTLRSVRCLLMPFLKSPVQHGGVNTEMSHAWLETAFCVNSVQQLFFSVRQDAC